MTGNHIIVNGRLSSPAEAAFQLDDVDVTYGYGCYETLKVRDGVLYFAGFHEERLLRSAAILGIEHSMRPGDLVAALELLNRANALDSCNIKVMMTGHEGRPADWYAFMLPPVVPPATAYGEGVRCLLFRGERHFPAAKSLSMLLSTVAYRSATSVGCYDALLVNGAGEITEGTRTNLFYARRGEADTVYTPPAAAVLEGITRRTLMTALGECGVKTVERPLPVSDAAGGEFALAVTSTSSRVIPVSALIGLAATQQPGRAGPAGCLPVPVAYPADTSAAVFVATAARSPELARVMAIYDAYLSRYAGQER